MKNKIYHFDKKSNADEMYYKIREQVIKNGFKFVSTRSHCEHSVTNREHPYQIRVTYKQSA